jgi:hypothetical protein
VQDSTGALRQIKTVEDSVGHFNRMLESAEEGKTAQDSAGYCTTVHDGTGQRRTVHDGTGQSRTVQDGTGQSRTCKTALDRAGQCKTALDRAGQCTTALDRAGQCKTALDRKGQCTTALDSAEQCRAAVETRYIYMLTFFSNYCISAGLIPSSRQICCRCVVSVLTQDKGWTAKINYNISVNTLKHDLRLIPLSTLLGLSLELTRSLQKVEVNYYLHML